MCLCSRKKMIAVDIVVMIIQINIHNYTNHYIYKCKLIQQIFSRFSIAMFWTQLHNYVPHLRMRLKVEVRFYPDIRACAYIVNL